jgi:predicted GIY-YIG superfamily endonuclease
MAKQKRATATVKMTYSEDSDLIAWWNSIPRGSRNAVMKDMMRRYIEHNRGGYRPIMPRNVPQPFDPGRFTQVCDDTAWIRTALTDLPGYMERVIQHVAANGGLQTNRRSPTGQGVLQGEAVSNEDAARRENRMKKAKW